MPIDVLIVGQGLAGSILAWEFIQQGHKVLVIDNGNMNASQVAAGLINPVTGQRLVKQTGIEQLLPAAMTCYEQFTSRFKQPFFKSLPMLRILKSPLEQQSVQKRLHQSDYQDYLSVVENAPDAMTAAYGVLQQHQTGYINTKALLTQIRLFLIENANYQQAIFDHAEICLQPNLSWRGIQARHLVFCEGHQALKNPWFGKLPFQLAKGEILQCHSLGIQQQHILNYGHWLIPNGEHRFKLGASFESGKTDTKTTEQAKQTLLQSLGKILPDLQPVSVLEQQAGIRPTTLDKQPFIGSHPQFANLHIFNGFGAKGSLLIPWYARQFAKSLFQKTTLPINADIQRYYETHFAH
jgi:glycine/D-amino acid oxidase-like deaminating enzyme